MIGNDTAYRIKCYFCTQQFKRSKPKCQNATIGKLSGVMSHLLNKDFQIHNIDEMHHICLMDHISLIDYVGLMDHILNWYDISYSNLYTLSNTKIEFL